MSRRSTVKPGGGSTSWPGSSSQLASGAGTVVSVGSGLALSGSTLATAQTTIFDCDFTTQSAHTFAAGVAKTITDSAGRSLPFTLATGGTASAALVNGSGLGLTTGSNGGRSVVYVPLSNISRVSIDSGGYRWWLRWASYSPLSTTAGLYTGQQIGIDGPYPSAYTASMFRQNPGSGSGNWYTDLISTSTNNATIASYDVLMLSQVNGQFAAHIGQWSSGWPSVSSMRPVGIASLPTAYYNMAGTSTSNLPPTLASCVYQLHFANLVDATSRTVYAANLRCDVW